MFSKPNIAITIVPQSVTKRVRYMPVAEATAGCRSSDMRTGLKIDPVPSPVNAPEKAPKNAIPKSLIIVLVVNSTSPFTKVYPISFFTKYSGLRRQKTGMRVNIITQMSRITSMDQSGTPHLVIPTIEGNLPSPLNNEIMVKSKSIPMFKANFGH